jgi:hypothetical protein
MSRSYREPWMVDSYKSRSKKFDKRWANKRVRKSTDVADGKAYRKYFDPWDIVDYKIWVGDDNWYWDAYYWEWRPPLIPRWKAIRK